MFKSVWYAGCEGRPELGAKARHADVRQELAAPRQQLLDHTQQAERSEVRRRGFVLAPLGAVLSLASGLVVALVRK